MKNKFLSSLLIAFVFLFGIQGESFADSKPVKTRGTVTFIFDDGDASVLQNAYPVFKKNNVVGSLAIYTNAIGKKGRLSVKDIQTMNKEGWEVLSHSVSHTSFKTMTPKEVEYELVRSKEVLNSHGVKVRGYVAPYSYYPSSEMQTLQRNYDFAFNGYVDSRTSTASEVIAISKNRYNLIRANMEGKSLEELKAYVDYAHKNGQWLVLYEHKIGVGNNTTAKTLEELIRYSKTKVSIRTASMVYGLK